MHFTDWIKYDIISTPNDIIYSSRDASSESLFFKDVIL